MLFSHDRSTFPNLTLPTYKPELDVTKLQTAPGSGGNLFSGILPANPSPGLGQGVDPEN